MARANQQRVVSLTTAITRTEDLLKTLRERMKRNRSKAHALYQAVVRASTSTSEAKVVTGQRPTTGESVTLTSIVEDTYATEQKLAAQVQCVYCNQTLAPSECTLT